MSRTTIKPVPGYSDALSDLNQVPVLTLADRVQQNIILPVLNTQANRESSGGGSRFLRSVNGSALINRQPVVLAELESAAIFCRPGEPRESWKPAQRGLWYSVDYWGPTYSNIIVRLYNRPDDVIYQMVWQDPILWLPRFQGRLYLRAIGPVERYAYIRVAQYG